MALSSTIYRFHLRLSDVTRNLYETFELRIAMHPSEAAPFLLTRVIAYALNYQDGLELTQGIASPDEPALQVKDLTGKMELWIEVGNPSARRLHKASKSAPLVRVYTYRDPAILEQEMRGAEIHRRETIEVFSLPPRFLDELAETLQRDNRWEVLHSDGELCVTAGDLAVQGELRAHRL